MHLQGSLQAVQPTRAQLLGTAPTSVSVCRDSKCKTANGEADSGDNGSDTKADDVNGSEEEDEDFDDGTEWKTDMSAAAIEKRQREQLSAAAASLVQGPPQVRRCPHLVLLVVEALVDAPR